MCYATNTYSYVEKCLIDLDIHPEWSNLSWNLHKISDAQIA